MRNYQLRSEYPCLVKWNDGEAFLEDGLALTFDKTEKLFIYPATGRREDVSFVLDLSNPTCPSYDIDDTTILYLSYNKNDFVIAKESIDCKGKTIKIEIGSNHIKFDDGEIIKIEEIIKPKSYILTEKENFVIVKIKSDIEEEAVLFNIETKKIFLINGERLEFEDDKILSLFAGKERRYVLNENSITKTKSFSSQKANSRALAMTFLTNLKDHDYKQACDLLSPNLQATESKLQAYFGEIENFLPLNRNEFLIIKKTSHNIVKFDVGDEYITNIELSD